VSGRSACSALTFERRYEASLPVNLELHYTSILDEIRPDRYHHHVHRPASLGNRADKHDSLTIHQDLISTTAVAPASRDTQSFDSHNYNSRHDALDVHQDLHTMTAMPLASSGGRAAKQLRSLESSPDRLFLEIDEILSPWFPSEFDVIKLECGEPKRSAVVDTEVAGQSTPFACDICPRVCGDSNELRYCIRPRGSRTTFPTANSL
jgi:hypothetical protein